MNAKKQASYSLAALVLAPLGQPFLDPRTRSSKGPRVWGRDKPWLLLKQTDAACMVLQRVEYMHLIACPEA